MPWGKPKPGKLRPNIAKPKMVRIKRKAQAQWACEHGIKYEQLLNGYMVMCQQCYEQHGLFKGRTVPMEEWANNVGNDPPKG
jgi:hypothetical protein